MLIQIAGKASRGVGSAVVILFYIVYLWRTFRSNPGNRLIECGTLTLIVFFPMVAVSIFFRPPDWLFFSWLILVVLLCFTTLFFLIQRGIRAGLNPQKNRAPDRARRSILIP